MGKSRDIYFKYNLTVLNGDEFMLNTQEDIEAVIKDYGILSLKTGKFTIISGKWVNVDFKYRLNNFINTFKLTILCRVRNIIDFFHSKNYNLHFNDFKQVYSYRNYCDRIDELLQVYNLPVNTNTTNAMEKRVYELQRQGKLTNMFELVEKDKELK